MADFLTFGPMTEGGPVYVIPVLQDGAQYEEEGHGKRKVTFELLPLPWATAPEPFDELTPAILRSLIGQPSGAESVRAWDGTLLTDLPLVPLGGEFATVMGWEAAEVRITGGSLRPAPVAVDPGDPPSFRHRLTLTLREA